MRHDAHVTGPADAVSPAPEGPVELVAVAVLDGDEAVVLGPTGAIESGPSGRAYRSERPRRARRHDLVGMGPSRWFGPQEGSGRG